MFNKIFGHKCNDCGKRGLPGKFVTITVGTISNRGNTGPTQVETWRCNNCSTKYQELIDDTLNSLIDSGRLKIVHED